MLNLLIMKEVCVVCECHNGRGNERAGKKWSEPDTI